MAGFSGQHSCSLPPPNRYNTPYRRGNEGTQLPTGADAYFGRENEYQRTHEQEPFCSGQHVHEANNCLRRQQILGSWQNAGEANGSCRRDRPLCFQTDPDDTERWRRAGSILPGQNVDDSNRNRSSFDAERLVRAGRISDDRTERLARGAHAGPAAGGASDMQRDQEYCTEGWEGGRCIRDDSPPQEGSTVRRRDEGRISDRSMGIWARGASGVQRNWGFCAERQEGERLPERMRPDLGTHLSFRAQPYLDTRTNGDPFPLEESSNVRRMDGGSIRDGAFGMQRDEVCFAHIPGQEYGRLPEMRRPNFEPGRQFPLPQRYHDTERIRGRLAPPQEGSNGWRRDGGRNSDGAFGVEGDQGRLAYGQEDGRLSEMGRPNFEHGRQFPLPQPYHDTERIHYCLAPPQEGSNGWRRDGGRNSDGGFGAERDQGRLAYTRRICDPVAPPQEDSNVRRRDEWQPQEQLPNHDFVRGSDAMGQGDHYSGHQVFRPSLFMRQGHHCSNGKRSPCQREEHRDCKRATAPAEWLNRAPVPVKLNNRRIKQASRFQAALQRLTVKDKPWTQTLTCDNYLGALPLGKDQEFYSTVVKFFRSFPTLQQIAEEGELRCQHCGELFKLKPGNWYHKRQISRALIGFLRLCHDCDSIVNQGKGTEGSTPTLPAHVSPISSEIGCNTPCEPTTGFGSAGSQLSTPC